MEEVVSPAMTAAFAAAGRCVVSVSRVLAVPAREARFQAEHKDGKVRTLYHGTSVAAAKSIASDGFRPGRKVGAFGKGINFTPEAEHTLLYTDESRPACVVVSDVFVGRAHANESRAVKGRRYSVPVHATPEAGYDSMLGADGLIVVVSRPSQAMPRYLVIHAPVRRLTS